MIMAEATARRARQQRPSRKIRATASTNLATGITSTRHHGRHFLSDPTTELIGDAHTTGRIFAKPTTAPPPGNTIRGLGNMDLPNLPDYTVAGEEARASL
jgi:hypothetical protein